MMVVRLVMPYIVGDTQYLSNKICPVTRSITQCRRSLS